MCVYHQLEKQILTEKGLIFLLLFVVSTVFKALCRKYETFLKLVQVDK